VISYEPSNLLREKIIVFKYFSEGEKNQIEIKGFTSSKWIGCPMLATIVSFQVRQKLLFFKCQKFRKLRSFLAEILNFFCIEAEICLSVLFMGLIV